MLTGDPQEVLFDLIAGRWRSQIVYAGAKLGVFDVLKTDPIPASVVARRLELHPDMTYRLLRALASIGLLEESQDQCFSLTAVGERLCRDHPQSLRDIVLLREGPEHYAVWKHLPEIIRDGVQNGFEREFGSPAFEYAAHVPEYAQAFDAAMSSYSRVQTAWALDALRTYDFAKISQLCDIGGGQGHLLCHFLARYPHLYGTVLERPSVIEDPQLLWAEKLGVAGRCRYVGGDMFREVPAADAYLLKMVLHNWADTECVQILRRARQSAMPAARLFIAEHIVPGIDQPHYAKLFDIHMMSWGTGRERTMEEYAELMQSAGWSYRAIWFPIRGDLGVIEAEGL